MIDFQQLPHCLCFLHSITTLLGDFTLHEWQLEVFTTPLHVVKILSNSSTGPNERGEKKQQTFTEVVAYEDVSQVEQQTHETQMLNSCDSLSAGGKLNES